MILQTPDPSPYDVNFSVAGIHVRVSFTFWLGSLFFGYQLVRSFARVPDSPGMAVLLVMWAACMFVSILIHELGHSLAFRWFGIHSHIVLYHFGGLAIPTSSRSIHRVGTEVHPWQQFVISAAGPGLQFLSALALVAVVWASGNYVQLPSIIPDAITRSLNQNAESFVSPVALQAMVYFYLVPSVFWVFLNLVPVFPLDGGQMCKAIVDWRGASSAVWLWISVIAGALMVIYGFRHEQWFIAILFASFTVSNYQSISPHERF